MKILITGATGFIGSNICESLVNEGHTVYATCRDSSVFDKCINFKDKIFWINQDKEDWQDKTLFPEIDALIHCAWTGVSAVDRDNWDIQLTNFDYSRSLFAFAKRLRVKKIIVLGSQAEYGAYSYKVAETHETKPQQAYGAVKLLILHYLRLFAEELNIEWYWLRVFAVIGKNENSNWLIPYIAGRLKHDESVQLTLGLQKYDYLFTSEFVEKFKKILIHSHNCSGVYNICSGREIEIASFLKQICENLGKSTRLLKFGAIPYREKQNMYMVGDPEKFEKTFGVSTKASVGILAYNVSLLYKII